MNKKKTPLVSGDATALLVIDVQQGLFERSTPVYMADQVLTNINALIDRAREAGVPVIFIQHSNDNTLIKGTPQWKFHPRIQPVLGESVIQKLEGNAFIGTDLGALLTGRQVGHLVITGLVTHGCVKSTCLGALELGYRVTLVTDGHSNFSPDAPTLIEKWNRDLGNQGAELKPTGQIIFNDVRG
jgi:nicotinamidase-related amidase